VLTTAAQTADKEYTVSLDGDKVGSFKGIVAVVPTAVKLSAPSIQGTIGKEVTVKAEVTVPEGQSKEGIPVTFNIANGTSNQLNEKIEKVAYTNAEGIATYSYTRYYKYNDTVTAYATEKSSVYASGKVYWAESLSLTEVTTGNSLANGSKKVYKVSSPEYAGKYVNVAFAENIGVTPDKAVRGVKVTDKQLGGEYPYQYTTGGHDFVQVKLDSNGNATFTLTGSNSKVTPIVFISEAVDGPTTTKPAGSADYAALNKYSTTALQATTAQVAFDAIQSFAIKVESLGVAAAAKYQDDNNRGGRDYKATVTNKDGQLAPKGTTVYVVVPSEKLDKTKSVWLVDKADSTKARKTVTGDVLIPLTTNAKGEVEFTLLGVENAFATPTVMQDNGSSPAKLDKNDLQTEGESVYFGKAIVEKATLTVLDKDGNEVKSVLGNGTDVAEFVYQSVDQNGNPYTTGTSFITSFQVTAGFNDVVTNKGTVTNGDTKTFDVLSNANGEAVLKVSSGKVSTAYVKASAAQSTLPVLDASVSFTDSLELPAKHTGIVTSINTVSKTIKFGNYDAVSYAKSTFKNVNGVTLSQQEFEKLVSANQGTVKVTAVKDADGVYSFEIVTLNADASAAVDAVNSATTAPQVKDALKSSNLSPDFNKLTDAQQTAVATVVLSDRNASGGGVFTATGLQNSYTKAYTDVALVAVKDATTDAQTEAAFGLVPGLKTGSLVGLTATEKTNVLTAIRGKVYATVAALQSALDAAVTAEKGSTLLGAVNGATTTAELLTALGNVPGINLSELNAASKRIKGLTLDAVLAGVSYADVAAVNAKIRTELDIAKDNTSVGIDSVTFTAASGGTPASLAIVFTDNLDLPATIASANLGSLELTFVDGNTLGADAEATYASKTLTITLGADHNIVGGTSVLKGIKVVDIYGQALDLSAKKSDGTTLVTPAANLVVTP